METNAEIDCVQTSELFFDIDVDEAVAHSRLRKKHLLSASAGQTDSGYLDVERLQQPLQRGSQCHGYDYAIPVPITRPHYTLDSSIFYFFPAS